MGEIEPMAKHKTPPKEYEVGDDLGRRTRRGAAEEMAVQLANDIAVLLVSEDLMGSRALVAERIRDVSAAEIAGDRQVIRAAWVAAAAACAANAANIDLQAKRFKAP